MSSYAIVTKVNCSICANFQFRKHFGFWYVGFGSSKKHLSEIVLWLADEKGPKRSSALLMTSQVDSWVDPRGVSHGSLFAISHLWHSSSYSLAPQIPAK